MIRALLGNDPLLLSVLDEYFTHDPYRAAEEAERIFRERQDAPSLTLLKITKPHNFFPSPMEARRLIEVSRSLGVEASRNLYKVSRQYDGRALALERSGREMLDRLREDLPSYDPKDILDEITVYTLSNYVHTLNLIPPPGEHRGAHDHIKLYHRTLILTYRVGAGLLGEAAALEGTIRAFERVGVYFDPLPIITHALVSGDDSYLYRAKIFYSLLGNGALRTLLEGVIAFLNGREFETYGSPILEQLREPEKGHYPVLSFPVRFARVMLTDKPFVSFAGEGGIYRYWRRVRLPRHESSFRVLAYFKVGSHFFGDGRRFTLENARHLFPNSPNPKKTVYDYLSRVGHLLYVPSDLLHAVRYGTFLSRRGEPWATKLKEVVLRLV